MARAQLAVAMCAWIGVVLVNSLFMWIARCRWPETEFGELYEMAGGGYFAWKPDVPGTASIMEYAGPTFVPGMSALEFLSVDPPHPSRVILLGLDGWTKEVEEFSHLQNRWIMQAPIGILNQLIPATEAQLKSYPDYYELAWLLWRCAELRGTPSQESLQGLADRTESAPLLAKLRGEFYDPDEHD